jgi:hypothetical protein
VLMSRITTTLIYERDSSGTRFLEIFYHLVFKIVFTLLLCKLRVVFYIYIHRDIQDRYHSILTPEANRQITSAASMSVISDTIYVRAQYDTLRRLRTYWILRYIIHKERVGELELVSIIFFAFFVEKITQSFLDFYLRLLKKTRKKLSA